MEVGDIDPERCLAVGDSVWDVQAARAAGIGCVAVESGGFSAHELARGGRGRRLPGRRRAAGAVPHRAARSPRRRQPDLSDTCVEERSVCDPQLVVVDEMLVRAAEQTWWRSGSAGADRAADVERAGPEVAAAGDGHAPEDGHDRARADGRTGEQPAEGLDERGEGLVVGEPRAGRRAWSRSGRSRCPRKGRRIRNIGSVAGRLDASAAIPMATENQVRANAISASTPKVANHRRAWRRAGTRWRRPRRGPPRGRAGPGSRLPSTWPVSTAAREMAIVRKRATMPSVMSMATEMAVP